MTLWHGRPTRLLGRWFANSVASVVLLACIGWEMHGYEYHVDWQKLHPLDSCVLQVNASKNTIIAGVKPLSMHFEVDAKAAGALADGGMKLDWPEAGDELLYVDGIPVSEKKLEEILQGPKGTVAILPIIKAYDMELVGFVKIEVLNAKEVTFKTRNQVRIQEHEKRRLQEEKRMLQLKLEQERIEHEVRQQMELKVREEQLARAKLEEERREAWNRREAERNRVEEEARLMREAQEKEKELKEQAQAQRGITKPELIPKMRKSGETFKYEVEFAPHGPGPLGLNWNMAITTQTVVMSVERDLPAGRAQSIEPMDQLIEVNGHDVSNMAPMQAIRILRDASSPKTLTFLCPGSNQKASKNEEQVTSHTTEPVTLNCIYPFLISLTSFQVDLASWGGILSLEDKCKLKWMHIASPESACGAIQKPIWGGVMSEIDPERQLGHLFFTYRGECTFLDKARRVQDVGGNGVVIVNNEEGDASFPTSSVLAEDINIPAGMIEKSEGDFLMSIIEKNPMLCTISQGWCPELNFDHVNVGSWLRLHLENLAPTSPGSGKLMVWKPQKDEGKEGEKGKEGEEDVPYITIDYVPAMFGGSILHTPFRAVLASPSDVETACTGKATSLLSKRGDVLVAKRGGCSFTQKASVAQGGGASGLIIINTEPTAIPFMSAPGEDRGLYIWVVGIGSEDGKRLLELLDQSEYKKAFIRLGSLLNDQAEQP